LEVLNINDSRSSCYRLELSILEVAASELSYEEYRRLDAHTIADKEYSIQKPFRMQELIGQLNEILLDQT